MPEITYDCVECKSTSIVSGNYLQHAYVNARCCSVHCYNKKNGITPKNTQEGDFELTI